MKIKYSFQLFRTNLFYSLLYEILFFLALLIFLIFLKVNFDQYQLYLQQFGPVLNAITAENLDPVQLQQTLDQISTVAQRFMIIIYSIPVILFLIWSFFQGSSWQLLKGKKKFDYKYLIKFSYITLPFFVAMGFILFRLFNLLSELLENYTVLFRPELWVLSVIFLLLYYFMLVAYVDLNNFLKNFGVALKKIYVMLPIALINLFLFFVLAVILTYLLILIIAGIYTSNIITVGILFLFSLILFIYSKYFLYVFFSNLFKISK